MYGDAVGRGGIAHSRIQPVELTRLRNRAGESLRARAKARLKANSDWYRRGLQFPPAAIRCAPGVGPQSPFATGSDSYGEARRPTYETVLQRPTGTGRPLRQAHRVSNRSRAPHGYTQGHGRCTDCAVPRTSCRRAATPSQPIRGGRKRIAQTGAEVAAGDRGGIQSLWPFHTKILIANKHKQSEERRHDEADRHRWRRIH